MKNANIELTRKQPNYGKIKSQIKREKERERERNKHVKRWIVALQVVEKSLSMQGSQIWHCT
jgi:hypothetical protein